MKELNIDTNLSLREINNINIHSTKKKALLILIVNIALYLLPMSYLFIKNVVNIYGFILCGFAWAIGCNRANTVYINKKEKENNEKNEIREKEINNLREALQKENVLIDNISLENATIISKRQKINYFDENKKEYRTISDIYLLDINDQIKVLNEVKSIINDSKNCRIKIEYNLLSDEEIKQKQKELNISKKIVIK